MNYKDLKSELERTKGELISAKREITSWKTRSRASERAANKANHRRGLAEGQLRAVSRQFQ